MQSISIQSTKCSTQGTDSSSKTLFLPESWASDNWNYEDLDGSGPRSYATANGMLNFKPHIVLTSQIRIFLRWFKKKNPIYKILEHINNQRFNLNFNATAKEQKNLLAFFIFIYLFEAHERTFVSVTSSQYLSQW